MTNAGARPGDALVLTKPIGTGIITTAGKQQRVEAEVLDAAVKVMSTLNRDAAKAMTRVGVNACTDVTGFGLLGHLKTMVEGSGVEARVSFGSVPLLDGVWDLIEEDIAPGGTRRNLDSVSQVVRWDAAVDEMARLVLCDAQTSGGLLISVAPENLDALLSELTAAGVETTAGVGEVLDRGTLGEQLIEVAP